MNNSTIDEKLNTKLNKKAAEYVEDVYTAYGGRGLVDHKILGRAVASRCYSSPDLRNLPLKIFFKKIMEYVYNEDKRFYDKYKIQTSGLVDEFIAGIKERFTYYNTGDAVDRMIESAEEIRVEVETDEYRRSCGFLFK